jgi:hypothetical protein
MILIMRIPIIAALWSSRNQNRWQLTPTGKTIRHGAENESEPTTGRRSAGASKRLAGGLRGDDVSHIETRRWILNCTSQTDLWCRGVMGDTPETRRTHAVVPSIRIEGTTARLRWSPRDCRVQGWRNQGPVARLFAGPSWVSRGRREVGKRQIGSGEAQSGA